MVVTRCLWHSNPACGTLYNPLHNVLRRVLLTVGSFTQFVCDTIVAVLKSNSVQVRDMKFPNGTRQSDVQQGKETEEPEVEWGAQNDTYVLQYFTDLDNTDYCEKRCEQAWRSATRGRRQTYELEQALYHTFA